MRKLLNINPKRQFDLSFYIFQQTSASLALGKKITIEEEVSVKDPYNAKTGGMVNMTALKAGKLKAASDDAFDTGIGTQFSAETNIGDTDEEMIKYVEEQLKKKKGIEVDSKEKEANKYLTPEEAAVIKLNFNQIEIFKKFHHRFLLFLHIFGRPQLRSLKKCSAIKCSTVFLKSTWVLNQKLRTSRRQKKQSNSF